MFEEEKDSDFDKLVEITRNHDLHIIEHNYESTNPFLQFSFWQVTNRPLKGCERIGDEYLNMKGIILYHTKTNQIGFRWKKGPLWPYLLAGVADYIENKFGKSPMLDINYWYLNE